MNNSHPPILYISIPWNNIKLVENNHILSTKLVTFVRFLESLKLKIVLYVTDIDVDGVKKVKYITTNNVSIKYIKSTKLDDVKLNISASDKAVVIDKVSYNLSSNKYKRYSYVYILYAAILSYIGAISYHSNIRTKALYVGKVYMYKYLSIVDVSHNFNSESSTNMDNFVKVYDQLIEENKDRVGSV